PIPHYECDAQGLQAAYNMDFPFVKDGLLFYCKAGLYTLGLSPLVLLWRDQHTSQYENQLSIVLRVQDDMSCVSLENIEFFTVSDDLKNTEEIAPGDLVRCQVESIKWSIPEEAEEADIEVTGVTFQKRCSPQRGLADSWTKLAHVGQAACSMQHLLLVVDDSSMEE
ncbi:unnamed protein product, partial [Aphanomyces euteiches]